jgi:tetratricopeptide (TPR) repeat protein
LEEALGIYRQLGDKPGQAQALNILGFVRLGTGDYLGAARDLEGALRISRDTGDAVGQANSLFGLGIIRRLTGDYPGAVTGLQEAQGIFRDIGDRGAGTPHVHRCPARNVIQTRPAPQTGLSGQ